MDAGDTDAIPKLFSNECHVYRAELPEPLVGAEAMKAVVAMAHRIYELGMLLHVGALESAR